MTVTGIRVTRRPNRRQIPEAVHHLDFIWRPPDPGRDDGRMAAVVEVWHEIGLPKKAPTLRRSPKGAA